MSCLLPAAWHSSMTVLTVYKVVIGTPDTSRHHRYIILDMESDVKPNQMKRGQGSFKEEPICAGNVFLTSMTKNILVRSSCMKHHFQGWPYHKIVNVIHNFDFDKFTIFS